MFRSLSLILCAAALAAPSAAKEKALEASEAAAGMTIHTFEMFRMAHGKTAAFNRDMALWDKVSVAGGQPPTQLFLHAGGEGWDVLLYKAARTKQTTEKEAAMGAEKAARG